MCLENHRLVWHCDKLSYPKSLRRWHFPQQVKSQGTYAFGFRHVESQTMAPLLAWERDTILWPSYKFHWKCSLENMTADEPAEGTAYDGGLALKICQGVSGWPEVLEVVQFNVYYELIRDIWMQLSKEKILLSNLTSPLIALMRVKCCNRLLGLWWV